MRASAPWLPERPGDKADINNYDSGTIYRDDAEDILQHIFIEEIKLESGNRKGQKIHRAYVRFTSRDGIERSYTFNLYRMGGMKEANEVIFSMTQLALQLPDNELNNWFADGVRFKKATLSDAGDGVVALLRYDPLHKKWMVVASRDSVSGADPTIKEFKEDGTNRFWSARTKDLVFGRYNKGLKAGPWQWWPHWKESEPRYEAPSDWAWCFKGIVETPQRLTQMAGYSLKDLATGTVNMWDTTETFVDTNSTAFNTTQRVAKYGAKLTGGLVVSPLVLGLGAAYGVGSTAWWGVSRSSILITDGLNVYTRGGASPEMIKKGLSSLVNPLVEKIGLDPISLYTGDDECGKRVKLFNQIADHDPDGTLKKEIIDRILHGIVQEHSATSLIAEKQ